MSSGETLRVSDSDSEVETSQTVSEPTENVIDVTKLSNEELEKQISKTIEEPEEEVKQEETVEEPVPVKKEENEEYKKLEERYKNLEKLMGKQSQELGQLRKFYQETAKKEEPKADDKPFLDRFVAEPEKALQEEFERRERSKMEKIEAERQIITTNVSRVYESVPEFDKLVGTIIELAKEDGVESPTTEMVSETVKVDPILAIQYAKRAIMKQKYEEALSKGKKVVENMAKGSQQQKQITKSNSSNNSVPKLTSKDITKLSDTELKEMLKKFNLG